MLKKILLPALALGAMGAFATSAQAHEVSSYVQISAGQSKAEKFELTKHIGNAWDYSSSNRTDTAYKIAVGLKINPHIAIEGQYIDLGKSKYKSGNYYMGTLDETGKASIDSYGLGMNLVGAYPVGDFSLFAKVGYHLMRTKYSQRVVEYGNPTYSESQSSSSRKLIPSFGVGVSYAMTNHLAVLIEHERFNGLGRGSKVNHFGDKYSVKHDVDFTSIGLRYHF